MNFLTVLKTLFGNRSPARPSLSPSESAAAAAAYEAHLAAGEAALAAYTAECVRQAKVASVRFEQQYGRYSAFLYQPNFDAFLRKQVLLFWEPEVENKRFLDNSHWARRHPFNFPGPFYAGESDTFGTGIEYAPDNVINGVDGEYVFKQPASYYELLCILNAAAIEVFDSYSSNGNEYWTYALCKSWWRGRAPLLHQLAQKKAIDRNEGQAQRYLEYLNGEAEIDLRRYCYFLENGVYPPNDQTELPEL